MSADPIDPTVELTANTIKPESAGRSGEIAARPREIAYQLDAMLGKGGMGEVWGAKDDRLGREVAIKRMRTTSPTKAELARFLREAKIQARLDHPAIVPVYELGTDDEGFPYFTMKKLVGTTLADVLKEGKATQQKLLRALVDVCLAIHRAHTERIVHRDLKPANIMLGEFGEVYVLDWGVARVIDEEVPETPSERVRLDSQSGTKTGQLLGTPGYMAPEQVRGQLVGAAADVYALGSILFEILAGETLHPRGAAALSTTLDTPTASPATRAPARAIPPELDQLCTEALAAEPEQRPTARELGDRIQQYLDGDRDIERRRVLAAQLVIDGRAALERGDTADAVRLGGRALALDPRNEDAARLVMSLLTNPPKTLPPEVEQQIAEVEVEAARTRSRRALYPMLVFFALTPLLSFLVVLDWMPLLGVYATIGFQALLAYVNWRVRRVPMALWLTANILTCVVFTRLSGPFVLTPVLIFAVMLAAVSQPWLNDRKWALLTMIICAVLIPFGLEEIGVFDRSWEMTSNGVVSTGTVFLRGQGNVWPLFISNLLMIVLVSMYALGISRDRRQAQRELLIQRWQLRQLLPR